MSKGVTPREQPVAVPGFSRNRVGLWAKATASVALPHPIVAHVVVEDKIRRIISRGYLPPSNAGFFSGCLVDMSVQYCRGVTVFALCVS